MLSGPVLVVIFALGFVLGGIIALSAYAIYQTSHKVPEVHHLQLPASDITLPELLPADGDTPARIADEFISQRAAFAGPGLVNFFASWCAPCEQEHPVLIRLSAQQIPIYGVLYHDRFDSGVAMLERLGSPYRRVLIDEQGESAVGYGLTGVPETLLIDAGGEVRGRWVGVLTEQAWQEQLQPLYRQLLQEAAADSSSDPSLPGDQTQ